MTKERIVNAPSRETLCSLFNDRALYNQRNFLHYLIPPILGAFYNNEN